jgi:putative transposase
LTRIERQALLEREDSDLSLSRQADLLSLARSSLYYQPVPVSAEELSIKRRIDEVYTAYPFYGVRRITAELRNGGLLINHKAVARHMQEMGLQAIYPGPNLSKRAQNHAVYPYLLRGLKVSRVNQVWGVDITYVPVRGGWVYLFAVLDWYSRFVLAWSVDLSLEIGFVLESMNLALTLGKPEICNSDQGSHFTSPKYTDLLLAAEVQISMDGKGRALDNIFTERLWRSVKYEEVYLKDYASPKEARQGLYDYFEFYNYRRLHQSLDYQTPASIYFKKGERSTDNFPILLS